MRDNDLEKVTLGICRRDWNQVLVELCPIKPVGETDLIVFPQMIDSQTGSRTLFTWKEMENFDIQPEELFEIAATNSIRNSSYSGMEDLLSKHGYEVPKNGLAMSVLTTNDGFFGAGLLATDVINLVVNRFKDKSFVVIPSSVHEVICTPVDIADKSEMNKLVCEINEAEVAPEEWLSDHVYLFENGILKNA